MKPEEQAALERQLRIKNGEWTVKVYCPRKPEEEWSRDAPEIARTEYEKDLKTLANAFIAANSPEIVAERKLVTDHLRAIVELNPGKRINIAATDAARIIALLDPNGASA